MNVEQTVNENILNYPSLFKDINYKYSREKVLNHLFFTNGNGYEWSSGELVLNNTSGEFTTEIPEDYFSTPIMSKAEDEATWMKEFRIENGRSFKPREKCSKHAGSVYPICKYAKILNLPDDIKTDWLEAAKETYEIGMAYFNDWKRFALDTYVKEWIKNREYTKIDEHKEKQKAYLSKVLVRIKELKALKAE